jgi:hypothetical protein
MSSYQVNLFCLIPPLREGTLFPPVRIGEDDFIETRPNVGQ